MAETPNTLCHVELNVRDLERAKAFYGALFGWQFRPFGPSMVAFGTDAGHIGGLQLAEEVNPGESPSLWFRVEEIEPLIARGESMGGHVTQPKGELPGVGWSAQIEDPDGNRIGLVRYT